MMSEHSPWHLLHVLERLAKERHSTAQGLGLQGLSPQGGSRPVQRSGGEGANDDAGLSFGDIKVLADPIFDIPEEAASTPEASVVHEPRRSLELEMGSIDKPV